ncbi:MAG: 3,4-dihydroxy-2-butanone-4-phosphate synthase [Rhodobacteraceae bacterium]|nr:3,4-dihydroxy-2-butanone-4-phosphate synthase [Paracoccaceae bacterium]
MDAGAMGNEPAGQREGKMTMSFIEREATAAMPWTEAGVMANLDEILAEARAGRMFILVDDEDRENEGDLVIPADCADAAAITFMAREGCGLICLALDGATVDRLGLPMMPRLGRGKTDTAFTASIEAREGVTTGISAADRARTVAVAVSGRTSLADIVSPGHVFPLRARDGGVLERAGHTEAAVEISRMAGRRPAAVICEVMNPDGTMARLDQLRQMAARHGLRIGMIRDLVSALSARFC